jgi:hypothetical protein
MQRVKGVRPSIVAKVKYDVEKNRAQRADVAKIHSQQGLLSQHEDKVAFHPLAVVMDMIPSGRMQNAFQLCSFRQEDPTQHKAAAVDEWRRRRANLSCLG